VYLPSAPGHERLELAHVDERLRASHLVLLAQRLDPRMVQALLDVGAPAHVLDEQPGDEVLGKVAGVAEVLLVEAVVDVGDVGEGLLFGVA